MIETKYIPIDKLEIDPMNVRPEPDADPELIDSVRDEGFIEPLVVRPRKGGKYGVVVGGKRFVAAKAPEVNMKKPRCEVRKDLDDKGARRLSFKENEHRGDIPKWKKRDIIREEFEDTNSQETRGKRVAEVAERLNLPRSSVYDYLDISEKLDPTINIRLKEPSKRTDVEIKQLKSLSEKLSLATNEEEGFDLEKEEGGGFPTLTEIPQKVSKILSDSDFFVELQEKDLGKAHELATDAVKAGQKRAPKIISKWKKEMKGSKKKKRKKGSEPVELTIEINPASADGLDKMVEDESYGAINDRETAAVTAIYVFLQDENLIEV